MGQRMGSCVGHRTVNGHGYALSNVDLDGLDETIHKLENELQTQKDENEHLKEKLRRRTSHPCSPSSSLLSSSEDASSTSTPTTIPIPIINTTNATEEKVFEIETGREDEEEKKEEQMQTKILFFVPPCASAVRSL